MALFDFLKGKKKNARRTGVRTGPADDRRADQATQQMNLPPPPPPPPATGGAPFRSPGPGATPPEGATVVRRPQGAAPPQTVPPSPVAPPSTAAPPPPPANPAPQFADSGQTQYITINSGSAGEIVGVLAAIDGELSGQLYRVVDGRNRLGRGTDCEVELNSQKISRSHAEIIHERGTFAIMPLSDKNPTFVNDAETSGDELRDGDTIRLGLTTLKFRTL